MALSDGHPQAIPNTALAVFDPPTYFQQQQSNECTLSFSTKTTCNNLELNLKPKNNKGHSGRPIIGLISPEDEQQQLPCEQYKEFLDASHHERVDMIDHLVDVSVDIIDTIWPSPSQAKVVATKGFVREILKRSKTTYFMLQTSLFYIFRVKRVVQTKLRMAAGERRYLDNLMCCGRRMFLASLIVASKYIHDKSYRNKAWADASGLSLVEINASELAFLQMVDYRLYISKPTFEKWYAMLNQRLDQQKQRRHQQQQQLTPVSTSPQQNELSLRPYPQKYDHHCLTTPKAIRKPTATTTAPVILAKKISLAALSSHTTITTAIPFVPSSTTGPSVASSYYPSPDTPYF